ncbi:MAG: dihydroorotase [Leptospiraceae bacterium]|nr:dihydroorotase [Leptospiraceae bacterium]MDW7976839.1 dihydroorotase [Leptospiraceae bacterium]
MKSTKILFKLPKADDFHLHLRDGIYLKHTVPYTAKSYARAVIMPNIKPPVTSIVLAKNYRERIIQNVPSDTTFEPLMTLYLNPQVKLQEIQEIPHHPEIIGIKLYPSGATTHSEEGVETIEDFYPYFEFMEKYHVPLMIHAEVVDPDVDIFDREKVFIDRHLIKIRESFPELKITFEHVSTREAVDFVNAYRNTAATITPQHLLLTRNELLVGGIRPHHYCLPVVKTKEDQKAILEQIVKQNPKFFAGTDSAPHPKQKKESHRGPAGIFTSPISIELYFFAFFSYIKNQSLDITVLEDLMQNFLCRFGSEYYGLPINQNKELYLVEEEFVIPDSYPFGDEEVVPLWAGEKLPWKIYTKDEFEKYHKI